MNIDTLEHYAGIKGLNVLGTGDFTHPKWLSELKQKLVRNEEGIYYTDKGKTGWIITGELASIYKQDGKVRKIHTVFTVPDLEIAEQINDDLKKDFNISYDGRPILGLPIPELVERITNYSGRVGVIPAHIWTPWFSLFGSMSGFDKVEDCFKDQTKKITALETGLSSDPEMNWMLSQLDKYSLVSNSDCHSAFPFRLGREANVFEFEEITYNKIIDSLRNKDRNTFKYTIEVEPAYGKYHFDGHRNCHTSVNPELIKDEKCPVCGKRLTIGVLRRVLELADRKAGFVPENAIPFKKILPLQELISLSTGMKSMNSKKSLLVYNELISAFKTEYEILLTTPREDLIKVADNGLADLIILNRSGRLKIKPGYDGVYGEVSLEKEKMQKTMSDY
ncbi:MAG: endonuclease Q family protein [Candidatus Omnitrophica bacterium]|nr:endonuclease Q family protein [Candidatus Omnitrophota bacterium]